MAAAYILIPGAAAPVAAERCKERIDYVKARWAREVEELLSAFHERAVNRLWARLNTPGRSLFRGIYDREQSDELFFELRWCVDGPWPFWAYGYLSNFGDIDHRRKSDETVISQYEKMFSAGLDVFVDSTDYAKLLQLDAVFPVRYNTRVDGAPLPPFPPTPSSTS